MIRIQLVCGEQLNKVNMLNLIDVADLGYKGLMSKSSSGEHMVNLVSHFV